MLSSFEKDPRYGHLYEHNSAFRQLTNEHKELKREVEKLKKAVYLGPDLENKMHVLKKQKLDIKDRLEAMLDEVPR